MDSQLENKLYEKFPDLYREKTASLESSKMPWGVQCGAGWYKIIYDLSTNIAKIATKGEYSPAISQISRHEDGTLHVDVRNVTPPIADIVTTARDASKLTCENCSYSPAILREAKAPRTPHIACARCVDMLMGQHKQKPTKRKQPARRAADIIVVRR